MPRGANAIDGPSIAVSMVENVDWNTLPEFAGIREMKVMEQADIDYVIGDASKSGDIYAATHSAWFCAMEL